MSEPAGAETGSAGEVEQLTGKPVHERVPDWVVRRASQIEEAGASGIDVLIIGRHEPTPERATNAEGREGPRPGGE